MIETARLVLRPWEERDRAPFAAINADPEVMRHFPGPLDRAASDAFIDRRLAQRAEDGIAYAAVELRADGALLGFAGLARMRMPEVAHLDGGVEIGWRLGRAHWGRGYATEAARGWLAHGFGPLALDEIVAFTVPANHRSQAVMRRLGMEEDPAGGFEHPALPAGSPLRPHLLFRIGRDRWFRHGAA